MFAMLKRTSLAPFDFYLINTNTWVYEYVGTSSGNSLYFYVDKPSLPGNYKVWYEGPNESNMTPGTQLMGEPYTGVTWSSIMVAFTSQSDYETLLTRLEEAYEDHSDDFFITYSSLTDEQLDAQIDIAGFDENLPLRDFEGYFGLTSLRASVAAGEDSYLNGYLEDDPDDDCIVSDEIQRTIMTTFAQFAVGGTTYTAPSESNSALCRIVQRRVSKIENSTNDRRTKIVTEFSGAYLGTHLVSKTKYFKKKSGGGWKKIIPPY